MVWFPEIFYDRKGYKCTPYIHYINIQFINKYTIYRYLIYKLKLYINISKQILYKYITYTLIYFVLLQPAPIMPFPHSLYALLHGTFSSHQMVHTLICLHTTGIPKPSLLIPSLKMTSTILIVPFLFCGPHARVCALTFKTTSFI